MIKGGFEKNLSHSMSLELLDSSLLQMCVVIVKMKE